MTSTGRIPALIVSGFLGSGKTTLVRHLLADAQRGGVRVAVVSNEFGELGIDRELFGNPEDSDAANPYVELDGGCVCCRLSDELVDTLQMLRERAKPDRVIVETSGIALPYDVQLNFWRDPIADWIDDDVAVVVVNAEQLHAGRDLQETFEHQVSSADILLLNKVDLVPESSLPSLEAALREIEPDAPILRTVHGVVDPAALFPPDPEHVRGARRGAGAKTHPHAHDDFESSVLEIPAGADPEELERRLAECGALRIKGFVETSQGLRLVQGVGARIELGAVDVRPPENLLGRLVVIRRSAG
jgi:cobalamin biosynthesis protein CobW